MTRQSAEHATIDAELDKVRSLDIVALRQRWRAVFGGTPPSGLTKDIMARMIAYRIQEAAFGGLDRDTVKVVEQPNIKPGKRGRSSIQSSHHAPRSADHG